MRELGFFFFLRIAVAVSSTLGKRQRQNQDFRRLDVYLFLLRAGRITIGASSISVLVLWFLGAKAWTYFKLTLRLCSTWSGTADMAKSFEVKITANSRCLTGDVVGVFESSVFSGWEIGREGGWYMKDRMWVRDVEDDEELSSFKMKDALGYLKRLAGDPRKDPCANTGNWSKVLDTPVLSDFKEDTLSFLNHLPLSTNRCSCA